MPDDEVEFHRYGAFLIGLRGVHEQGFQELCAVPRHSQPIARHGGREEEGAEEPGRRRPRRTPHGNALCFERNYVSNKPVALFKLTFACVQIIVVAHSMLEGKVLFV